MKLPVRSRHSVPTRARRTGTPFLACVEALDDRLLLSTFTVANLDDAGPGSLRAALIDANAAPGADSIRFFVVGTISLTSAPLPAITDRVVIDGTTAPGFRQNPVVEVDFNSFDGLKFNVGSASSSLRSLALVDAGSDAVTLNDTGNLVTGNFIGVGLDGTTAIPNRGFGLTINAASTGNTIGATTTVSTTTVLPLVSNLISANRDGGIAIHGSTGNLLVANYIGTNAKGTAALGNGGDGLRLDSGSTNNTIGGVVPFVNSQGTVPLSNLISGNRGSGIVLTGGSSNNFLAANFVGTNNTGDAPLGNDGDGIAIAAGSNNNNLQGTVDGQSPFIYANIVSGNHGNGLRISSSNTTTVQANFFGLGYDNMTPVGNGLDGALVEGSSNTVTFGGNIPLGNVTSANGRNGIEVRDTATGFLAFNSFSGTDAFKQLTNLGNGLNGFLVSSTGGNNVIRTSVSSNNHANGVEISGSATGVQVAECEIGTSTNGMVALPNGANGVLVSGDAHNNTIGGKIPNSFSIIPHNVISGNIGHGVAITGTAHNNAVTFGYIGTSTGGKQPVPNGGAGVFLSSGTANNTVGGTAPDTFNIISGNLGNGIQLSGTSGNVIVGNLIGTDPSRVVPIGNGGSGILIIASSNDRIAGNVISNNVAAGIFVNSGNGNAIVGNSIFNNGSKGIVLGRGANQDQAAPVLTFLKRFNNRSALRGVLKSLANGIYHVEFFANATPAVRTAASGQTPLGTIDVTTNNRGVGRFLFFLKTMPKSTFFTATATSSVGDSSEFSNAIPRR